MRKSKHNRATLAEGVRDGKRMKDSCAINRRNLDSPPRFTHPYSLDVRSMAQNVLVPPHLLQITILRREDETEISRICLFASQSLIDYISLSVSDAMPTFFPF